MHQLCQQLVASHPSPWSPTPRVVTKSHPVHQKLQTQNIKATAIPIIQLQLGSPPPSMGQITLLSMPSLSKTPQ